MSTPNADAWELAGFPGRLDVAAYLTADQLAAQYRVLVDVLPIGLDLCSQWSRP
jgi:hypothetical protein